MELDNILFQDHPNPMFIYSIDDLQIIDVNKLFLQTYGYSQDEAKSLTLKDIYYEEDLSASEKRKINSVNGTKPIKSGTIRHRTKSGDTLFVQVTSQQFEVKNKNAQIAHIYNITDTVKLKNKYKNTLEELVLLIDENPLAMVKFDHNMKIIDWSKQAEKKLGYSADEAMGKTPFDFDLFPSEEHHLIKNNIDGIISNRSQKSRFETIANSKRGEQLYVKMHASALKNQNNELQTLITFLEDISAEKRIEQLFESTEEMAQMGGWEYNPHTDNLYWTDQVYRIYEVPMHKNVTVEEAFDFFMPDDKKRITKFFKSAMENHISYDSEFRIQTAKGNKKWVRAMGRPVIRNGKTFKIIGIFADIDDQKAKREELKKRAQENKVLLSEVHHRVKNNLAVISGLLELKSVEAENEKVKEILKHSQLRIQSMAMIHEALYEADNFSKLPFSDFVRNLVTNIEDAHGFYFEQSIQTHVSCKDSFDLNVNQAIPCGLIINEAVSNSFKHAFGKHNSGNIYVNIDDNSEGEVTLTIYDDGKGLPEKFIEGKSNSLGGTLIRKLAKQLNGELKIKNDDGANIEITFKKSDHSGSSSNLF